jgi:hypothetical protein
LDVPTSQGFADVVELVRVIERKKVRRSAAAARLGGFAESRALA